MHYLSVSAYYMPPDFAGVMSGNQEDFEEQLESALRKISDLELALAQCRRASQTAEEESASAKEELEQLAYAAGHDLREPLRGIAAYSQLLERQFAQEPEAAELIHFVTESVARMNAVITDLVTYSRAGAVPKRIPMSLSLAVRWAAMNLDGPIRESGAQITYPNLPEAAVEEAQIVRLFTNLIENALKFRSAAVPEISITYEESDEGYVIAVKDNGSGIDPKYQKQVFGVFKRLHGRDVPGTGIGLSVCRRIVTAHGGKIWIESDGEHGSVFKFSLPF